MIAVDWGSTSLRLYRLDDEGCILDQRRSGQGILTCHGRFADVLVEQIQGWNDGVIVLSGMIGSRSGWHEVPYVECPASPQELAKAIRPLTVPVFAPRRLWLVPGLSCRSRSGVIDVMRGEEAQIAGLPKELMAGSHKVCLPGTHSKWVTLRDGCIERFSTSMTGEIYEVLRQHSILGKLMVEGGELSMTAFDTGLKRSGDGGSLLHHLFGIRTAGLFKQFSELELPSFLSGLLIGHEIRGLGRSKDSSVPRFVHVVGSEHLRVQYTRALSKLGIGVQWHHERSSAVGLHRVASLAGI